MTRALILGAALLIASGSASPTQSVPSAADLDNLLAPVAETRGKD